jgi:predicted Zn finger-like uncharacterized protein
MKDVPPSQSGSSRPGPTPPACPRCRSTDAVTTSASPDADSYWRCTKCGEVWNVARSQPNRYGAPRWR